MPNHILILFLHPCPDALLPLVSVCPGIFCKVNTMKVLGTYYVPHVFINQVGRPGVPLQRTSPPYHTLTLLLRLSGLWSLELETIRLQYLRKEVMFPSSVRCVLCLLDSCYPSLDLRVLCLLEGRSREVPSDGSFA